MSLSFPPMPLLSITSAKTIVNCASLHLRPSDVFICSYPKSGTTWTQHIVLSLLRCHVSNTSSNVPPNYTHVSDYAPFFEIDAHWDRNNHLSSDIQERHQLLGTRVFNTHLRFNMLPTSNCAGARLVYLIRSPLDACVSFYHHLVHQVEGGYEGTFDDFFQEWMAGDIAFGSWIHHVLSFVNAISTGQEQQVSSNSHTQVLLPDGRKILLVSYEEMLCNLSTVVKEIQDFLDLDSITCEQREEMLPTFEFANMKQNLDRFQPQSVQWKDDFTFLRKGTSGDSITMVSDMQRAEFIKCLETTNYHEWLTRLLKGSHPQVYEMLESVISEGNVVERRAGLSGL